MSTRIICLLLGITILCGGLLLHFLLRTETSLNPSEILAKSQVSTSVQPNDGAQPPANETLKAKTPGGKAAAPDLGISLEEVFNRHPGYQAAWNANFGRQILDGYGDIKTRLNLSDDAVKRLSQLLVEEKWLRVDAPEILKQRGITTDHPEYGKYLANMASSLEGEIKQVVGEENYDLLRLTPRIVRLEAELYTKYAWEFASTGCPLTNQQVKDLAVSMAIADKVVPSAKTGRKLRPGPEQGFLSDSQTSQLEAAKSILEPEQLEVLKKRFQDINMEEYYTHKYSQKK